MPWRKAGTEFTHQMQLWAASWKRCCGAAARRLPFFVSKDAADGGGATPFQQHPMDQHISLDLHSTWQA